MTKTQLKAIKFRIAALKAELDDPTCRRFPTARMHVQRVLDAELKKLPPE